jgi:TetR/AcrR family transcriptional regulator, cholesterol catabolism regulator
MSEGSTSRAERPREAILRVATRLFGESSYPATSMRDIASEIGILAGSLYAHIDGKESVLLEIIEGGINEFIDRVGAAAAGKELADERIRAMIHAHLSVVAANPQRTLIVFHQWRYLGQTNQALVRERRRKYENLFTQVIKDGVSEGIFSADLDQRITLLTILGALNWTPEWLSADGPGSVEKIGDKLADSLLSGLLTRPAKRRPKS